MKKGIFTITENRLVADRTWKMCLTPQDGTCHAEGEFVDIAIDGKYLRRPISICDCLEDGSIIIYYKTVGDGTSRMSGMQAGEHLDLLTGLGRGFNPGLCAGKALLVGGGLGAAPLHYLCRELLAQGREVSVVLGFNTASEIVLVEEFRAMGIEPAIATMDGSAGTKGFVTDAIAATNPEFDVFYSCGPMPMMRAVCKTIDAPGEVSLEERMGCGAGFCYGCTIQTVNGPRRVCKDGPVFNKEELVW